MNKNKQYGVNVWIYRKIELIRKLKIKKLKNTFYYNFRKKARKKN